VSRDERRPSPNKRLGQHFLHDPAVIARIVAAIDPRPGDALVEIGGGLGALTIPLRDRAGQLHVVEVDQRLAAGLDPLDGVTVHRADALTFDFATLAPPGRRLRIAGNLPYNISTPLLFHLLEDRSAIDDMHLMLQKEVVTRMAARPGGKEYGRLTVMLAPWLDIDALFDVGPGAFRPPPRVWSTVLRARVRREPRFELSDPREYARIVAKLFSMRRKTLGRILRDEMDAARIESIGLDPRARPETLAPEDFARLAGLSG
jgi:16S rRNA (adenine1518-N6/adenine1519-N6)-dimethyltransferase